MMVQQILEVGHVDDVFNSKIRCTVIASGYSAVYQES
jgi:hypothetical protein